MLAATTATEGCTPCARGFYSNGGTVSSCTPMTCAAGEYATILGSTTATEGCTLSECGKYSPTTTTPIGGLDMACPPGTIATLTGSTHDEDGCVLVAAGL